MSCIVFTGGGTGGHIFPGIAVAEVLKQEATIDIVWIGASKGNDRKYVEAAAIRFYGIPAGKLRRYISFHNIIDIFKVIGGFFASFILLLKLRPYILFSKGGFVSVPPCAAARCLGIPVITHECDFSPGLATKINAYFAKKILTSYKKTAEFFPHPAQKKIMYTGNPVRQAFYHADPNKGKKCIGYSGSKPILFIQGGSLGAAQVNTLIEHCIVFLTEHFFVVHQTGAAHNTHGEKIKKALEAAAPEHSSDYSFFPFINEEMPNVLACTDIIVSRAGANALWEASAAGKPLILIPLEKGSSRGDQIENAAFFAQRGAAIVLDAGNAVPEIFCATLQRLINNRQELHTMAAHSAALSADIPAITIANYLKGWITL